MDDFNKRYLDFCKPFIDSIINVYETMMSTQLKASKPVLNDGSKQIGDISSMMGISGIYEGGDEKRKFKGNLVISWSMDTYVKTAGAMLMEEYTEYSDEIADVGMEICNITMGGAKSVLEKIGFHIEMSIPTSMRGKELEYKPPEGIVTISTTLDSSLGPIIIALNYEDET